jgi:hypothetical protein
MSTRKKDTGIEDDYKAAYEGGIGADRMAVGLSIIPDKLRGDLEVVTALRAQLAEAQRERDQWRWVATRLVDQLRDGPVHDDWENVPSASLADFDKLNQTK